ncbi:DUF5333 domain-containing protein [Jannaschia pohangensis]|uniref:DUF5333 domain-containing protein n=1 Tax=Jannaschia pohangensis TaxID=390807 RepID=A0A1I3Q3C7_9RHOB|nr:DUF5333 domain-containing protein [Jannaschia pohangensis]SFJ28423.1 hypothetical protein SAMN04488095_2404 [Jannaschia pohangensis]
MTNRLSLATAAAFALAMTLGQAAAADRYDALRADPQISNGVLVAAIGDLIRDNCPAIGERRARSLLMLNSLVSRARTLGYSVGEIRAYVDDDAEKDRVKAEARRWLSQQGASAGDPASICRLAQREIAAGSTIGRLMYEK